MAKTLNDIISDTQGAEPTTKRPRGLDPELQAMATIDRILAKLADENAVGRILAWLVDRYDLRLVAVDPAGQPKPGNMEAKAKP